MKYGTRSTSSLNFVIPFGGIPGCVSAAISHSLSRKQWGPDSIGSASDSDPVSFLLPLFCFVPGRAESKWPGKEA